MLYCICFIRVHVFHPVRTRSSCMYTILGNLMLLLQTKLFPKKTRVQIASWKLIRIENGENGISKQSRSRQQLHVAKRLPVNMQPRTHVFINMYYVPYFHIYSIYSYNIDSIGPWRAGMNCLSIFWLPSSALFLPLCLSILSRAGIMSGISQLIL